MKRLSPFDRRHRRVSFHALALAFAVAASAAGAGCVPERPFVWISDLPPTDTSAAEIVHPRDSVVVAVRDQAALSGEFVVGEDGSLIMPTLGHVSAGGRTVQAVTEELTTRLATYVVHPIVTVSISKVAPIRVNVVGEVKTPAVYELTRDRSVTAALAAAGWLTEFANRDRIFVVRRERNLRVRFRAKEITTSDAAVAGFRLGDGDVVVVE
jgi:polysaccharide export outer membrane protein